MSKSLSVSGQRLSSAANTTGCHAPSSQVADPLRRMLLFSTPLLGRRGVNTPARRHDNDAVQLTGRSRHAPTLKRSLSMNVRSRRRSVAVNRTEVSSGDARKSPCLRPGTGADAVARYSVSRTELL